MWTWYASRATGLVSLGLLTSTVVLGLLVSGRHVTQRWPRFAIADVHRNLSLLTVVFLAVHIVTSIVDGYVTIGWLAVLVPFTSAYEPFWVGLGTVALDVLLALVVTSLLRARMPLRVWKAVHWAAYACWPLALAHGVAMGSGAWLVFSGICGVAVISALVWRSSRTDADTLARAR
jgi:predicted ferric reductase